MNINWEFIAKKFGELGAFLSDKQLWFKFILPNLFVLGILPYVKGPEDYDVLSDQAVAIVGLIVPLVTSLLVGFSNNKKMQSEVEQFISVIGDNIKK